MDARHARGELGLFKAGKAGWHAWAAVRGSCTECTQEARRGKLLCYRSAD
jgi:hypothetical protein